MTHILIPRKTLQAAVDAFNNHDGNYKLNKGQSDVQCAVVEKLQALLAAPCEPVAVRHNYDGYGWLYHDNGDGSNWLENGIKYYDGEPLYAAPKEPI